MAARATVARSAQERQANDAAPQGERRHDVQRDTDSRGVQIDRGAAMAGRENQLLKAVLQGMDRRCDGCILGRNQARGRSAARSDLNGTKSEYVVVASLGA